MYEVVVDVNIIEPNTVENASTVFAFLSQFGSLLSKSACLPTANRVPVVSKKSMYKNTKIAM